MAPPRSGRLKAAFLRLLAACMAAAMFSGLALGDEAAPARPKLAPAGEAATTHRAGDLVVYRFACHAAEDMIAIAERARPPAWRAPADRPSLGLPTKSRQSGGPAGANELAAILVEQGQCFQNPVCIAARLEAWIAGPYPPEYGSRRARGAAGSVWRVRDQFGDTEFVWINDRGGRHAARREMAL